MKLYGTSGKREWGAYYGGNGFESGNACAVANGGVYVAGYTGSLNLPVLNAHQSTKGDTYTSDTFLARLSGQAPEIDVTEGGTAIASGGTSDFGTLQLCQNDTKSYTITNTGNQTLTLGWLSISGSPWFALNVPGTFSTALAPGASTQFSVTYAPLSLSLGVSAQVQIANNDGNENPYVINLTGKATHDTTPPLLTCATTTVELDANGTVTVNLSAVSTATDGTCGVQTHTFADGSTQKTFTCADLGTHTLGVTATDNNGNTATCNVTLTVEDNIAPTVSCVAGPLFVEPAQTLTAADVHGNSADNCGTPTLSLSPTNFACSDRGTVLYANDFNQSDLSNRGVTPTDTAALTSAPTPKQATHTKNTTRRATQPATSATAHSPSTKAQTAKRATGSGKSPTPRAAR